MAIFRKFIFLLYCLTVNCSGSAKSSGNVEKGLEILFLGLSGSGKSSTINMLLGNRVISDVAKKTNELKPTKSIIEYTLWDEDENSSENSEINEDEPSEDHYFVRFIDTPGLGSTIGVVHEARIMSTLQKYLMQKGSSLPSVILIVSKFDDNRVAGNNSNFVKLLKKINELADQVYSRQGEIRPQIIFVFTHYLGITKREQRNPKAKISMFTNIIQNYTTFPTPIVTSIAENEAEDEELDLDEDTGSYVLPNGELYPQNLVDKILDAFRNKSTPSEFNSYERIFERREELNFQSKISQGIVSVDKISASVIESDLKDKLQFLNLQQSQKHSTEKYLAENEVTANNLEHENFDNANSFNEVSPSNSINENITTESSVNENIVTTATETAEIFDKLDKCSTYDVIPSELESLKNILSEQNITELPKREVTLFIQKLSLSINQIGVLENCFGIAIPMLNMEDPIVGYGYDILRNLPLADTPFKTEELIHSSLGFKIPAWINSSMIKPEEELAIQNYFNNSEEFLHMRLNNLTLGNLQLGIKEKDYTPQFTVGNNFRDRWSDEEIVKITSLQEYRLFSWSLRELNSFGFNDEFLETLSELPTFDTFNKDSVNEWTSFFTTYGTHIVTFAYGGGSLETHVHVKRTDIDSLPTNEFFPIPEPSNNFTSHIRNPQLDKLKFNGGHEKYRKYLNFKDIDDSMYKIFSSWHQSLPIHPIILETNLKLKPLSEVIKSKFLNLSEEMEKAAKSYLTGNLKYIKLTVTERSNTTELENSGNENKVTIEVYDARKSKVTTENSDAEENEIHTESIRMEWSQESTIETFTSSQASMTVRTKTTEIPIFLTLQTGEITMPSPESRNFSSGSERAQNGIFEITEEDFRSHIKAIREIVSTFTGTCNMSLPELQQSVLNTVVNYQKVSRPIFDNLRGLINVMITSGSFCRNKYYYEDSLEKLREEIRNRRLSIEKLSQIYKEMRFSFPQSPNEFHCNPIKIGSSLEYLGSHIGYGYNIQYNLPIKRSPFASVNRNIQCDKTFREDNVTYTYKILRNDSQNYYEQELRNLSPYEPKYNFVQFYGPLPSGVYFGNRNYKYYKWLEEYVIYSAHFSTNKQLHFSFDFKNRVSLLPELNYNRAIGNCIEKLVLINWKKLFNEYGTHIVMSSNVGGALKIVPDSLTWSKHFQHFDKYNEDEIIEGIKKDGLKYFCLGGNASELYKNGLSLASINSWRKSLHEKPTLLQSGLRLTPIINFIKVLRPNLAATAHAVMTSLYAGGIRTYCNCTDCDESSICYSERHGNLPRTYLGMCYLPNPDQYQCSIRHVGHRMNCQ